MSDPINLSDQLSPNDRLASCQRKLEGTKAELTGVEQNLRNLRDQLSQAEKARSDLPVEIAESSFDLTTLGHELVSLEGKLREAVSGAESAVIVAEKQTDEVNSRAVADHQQEISSAGKRIEEARRLRDEERKRIGALPSVQDEIVRARQLKRDAQSQADHRLNSRITAARDGRARMIAEAQAKVRQLEGLQASTVQLQQQTQKLLAIAKARLELVPSQIAELKSAISSAEYSLTSLKDSQERQEQAVALAQCGVQYLRKLEAERKQWNESAKLRESLKPELILMGAPKWELAEANFRYSESARYWPTGSHQVRGYTRRDGTTVRPYRRTNHDWTPMNNFSTKGNMNPYTGKVGKKRYRQISEKW